MWAESASEHDSYNNLAHGGILADCHQPLRSWFFAAFVLALSFCLAFIVGRRAEDNKDAAWFIKPRTLIGRLAFASTWVGLLPLLATWSVLGFIWLIEILDETPECFPESYHLPAVIVVMVVLGGLCSLAYAVFVMNVWMAARCLSVNASAIEAVEDNDLVQRWGPMKASATEELSGGLLPDELALLPLHECDDEAEISCTICLSSIHKGDRVRTVAACGHCFHRPCADLWLLRSTRCPLCNRDARSPAAASCTEEGTVVAPSSTCSSGSSEAAAMAEP